MSRRSLTPSDSRQQRKLAKRAERRRPHVDKYAPKADNPDSEMSRKLDELLARFNGEEADRG